MATQSIRNSATSSNTRDMPVHLQCAGRLPGGQDPSREPHLITGEGCAPPFHPTLASSSASATAATEMKTLELTASQSDLIADSTMAELGERTSKRRRIDARSADDEEEPYVDDEAIFRFLLEYGEDGYESEGEGFDVLEELDANPAVAQFVATPGGLITHWNEAFADATRPPNALPSSNPLALFDLVRPTHLSSLYQMLALSLHGEKAAAIGAKAPGPDREGGSSVGTRTDDESDGGRGCEGPTSYLSITLPCRSFCNVLRYDITVVFMDDAVPANRCFFGMLVPTPGRGVDGPRVNARPQQGELICMEDEALCRMLLGGD